MNLDDTVFSSTKRQKRPPMRTIVELAAELGVPMARLRILLALHNGPAPLRVSSSPAASGRRVYYPRAEVLRWYAALGAQSTDQPIDLSGNA